MKKRVITIVSLAVGVMLLISFPKLVHKFSQSATAASAATAVTTYQSIGLYWSPPDGSATNQCNVQYRVQGTTAWKQGLPLWYDARALGGRPAEYRGSLVLLQPGTTYDIQLTLASGTSTTLTTTTWNENYPITQTVTVPSGNAYNITQGGSPNGYILYTGPATINGGSSQNGVTISASYVIVRGLTITGGSQNGIYVTNSAHDVIIEKSDISAFGPTCSGASQACGEGDGGIKIDESGSYYHLTIQRNKIHTPNGNANTSCEPVDYTHPAGPRVMYIPSAAYNNVIRYNEGYGDINHLYDDFIGSNNNFSLTGFPNRDSDVNGNLLEYSADDSIESEGGNMNTRVWGNYVDKSYTGVSSATVAIGPLYIFRNVYGYSKKCSRTGFDNSGEHGPFDKAGDNSGFGGGRRYLFHNTTLQPGGAGGAFSSIVGSGGTLTNSVLYNNVWNVTSSCYDLTRSTSSDTYDYNLCSSGAHGPHDVSGKPIYIPGNGDYTGPSGMYQLASNSPGYHKGLVLPNFNDDFGSQPDMGAQPSGGAKMEFGINAYLSNTPSPTQPQSGTTFSVTVCPHGLGNCGDNANTNNGGNTVPKHQSISATLTLLNSTNQPIASGQGSVTYNSSAQNFQGSISIANVSSGQYLAQITLPGFLPKQLPGIITVSAQQNIVLPSVSLTTGNINNDQQLDILDYNLLISCFGSKQTTPSCTTPPTQQSSGSDINDDGTVDGADYNLILREFSVQKAG